MNRLISFPSLAAILLIAVAIQTLPFLNALSYLNNLWLKATDTYTHGYLLLGMAMYLIWLRLPLMVAASNRPDKWLVLLISSVYLALNISIYSAEIMGVSTLQLVLLPLMLLASLAALFGIRSAFIIIPAFSLIYFGLPIWDGLSEVLRQLAVLVVQQVLGVFGIPAFIDGYFIELSYGVVEVAGSCSGLKYLLVGVSLVIFSAELTDRTARSKIQLILGALALALLSNWLRVVALVLVAHYSDMQHSLVRDHDTFGWILFAVVFIPYIWAVSNWLPVNGENASHRTCTSNLHRGSKLLFAVLIFTGLIFNALGWQLRKTGEMVQYDFSVPGYMPLITEEKNVGFFGFDRKINFEGFENGLTTSLELLVYLEQKQGKELVAYDNRIVQGDEKIVETLASKVGSVALIELVDGQRLVYWVYLVGRKATSSVYWAKYYELPKLLSGPKYSALLSLSYRCGGRKCSNQEVDDFTSINFKEVVQSMQVRKLEQRG